MLASGRVGVCVDAVARADVQVVSLLLLSAGALFLVYVVCVAAVAASPTPRHGLHRGRATLPKVNSFVVYGNCVAVNGTRPSEEASDMQQTFYITNVHAAVCTD